MLTQEKIYTVGEICRNIKATLEQRFAGGVWIEGEISNMRVPSSGHAYFSLKDAEGMINAVMFRGSASGLRFAPVDGLKVLVFGELTIYEARGVYQVIVRRMEPQGLGALQLAFEQLKAKLEAEGLFDVARKKAIPTFPQRIAIVTSPTGAAIRDILHVLGRRFSNLDIAIYPAAVQGKGAAAEIAQGLHDINEIGGFDIILVTRGGGSLEDLWPFNEEILARAIAASRIPVVSAVGHEIDTTICDMVADLRCATPSAAAELIIGRKEDILSHLESLREALCVSLETLVLKLHNRLQWVLRSPGFLESGKLVESYAQRVDDAREGMEECLSRGLERAQADFRRLMEKLDVLSPLGVLGRGYSITFKQGSDSIVRDAQELKVGDTIKSMLAKGSVVSKISATQ